MAKSLIPASAKVSLEELSKRIAESGQQELRVIIKGDVQGSVEAVADALTKLSTEKVRLSRHPRRRRRHHRGRREPRDRGQGDHHRLQRSSRPASRRRSPRRTRSRSGMYSIIYNAVDDMKRGDGGAPPRRRWSRRRPARPRSAPSSRSRTGRRRRLLRHRGQGPARGHRSPASATARCSGRARWRRSDASRTT